METIFNRLVPENRPEYEHTLEGADNMNNPQSTFRLRICFFTVQEQESPQVALEVKTYQVNRVHG